MQDVDGVASFVAIDEQFKNTNDVLVMLSLDLPFFSVF